MVLENLVEQCLLRRPRHIGAGGASCARVAHMRVVDNPRRVLRKEGARSSGRSVADRVKETA